MNNLIIVDKNDTPLGLEDKIKCHLGKGILHRAFSVFIFKNKGELLIQQRSDQKLLWPLYWSNTCCSHPLEGETYKLAAKRRLKEELGFTCELDLIGSFIYRASYKDVGSEYELCSVLRGKYNGEINTTPEEVADWKWVNTEELKRDIRINPDKYTPWFKIELQKFFNL